MDWSQDWFEDGCCSSDEYHYPVDELGPSEYAESPSDVLLAHRPGFVMQGIASACKTSVDSWVFLIASLQVHAEWVCGNLGSVPIGVPARIGFDGQSSLYVTGNPQVL